MANDIWNASEVHAQKIVLAARPSRVTNTESKIVQENDYPVHGDTILATRRHESVRQTDSRIRENPIRSQVNPDDTLTPPFDGNDDENSVRVRPVEELLFRSQGEVDKDLGLRLRAENMKK